VLDFAFFYSFSQNFAESLKALTAHLCREPELRLTAKSSLPAELCRERYPAATQGNSFAVSEPCFAVRNRLTATRLNPVVILMFEIWRLDHRSLLSQLM
jgi:hypothetical protein